MSADLRLELALPRILEDLGTGAEPDYVDDLLARTELLPQRRVLATTGVVPRARVAWQLIAAAALLALAVAAAALFAGSRTTETPPLTGPAGNGVVAYVDWKGDLFVGDPRDGSSTLVVDNAELGVDPVFSPDGSRIAFIGGTIRDPGIFVVRVDGSDLLLIAPARDGRNRDGPLPISRIAWTADGTSIIGAHRDDVVLFDASANHEPRVISSADAEALRTDGVRNPAISPAGGAQLLFDDSGPIAVRAADGTTTILVDPSTPGGLTSVGAPAWSPDGSLVMFEAATARNGGGRIFVIRPDGTGLRQLSRAESLQGEDGDQNGRWSPDGSLIAAERIFPSTSRQSERRLTNEPGAFSELVIFDVASGAERAVADTRIGTFHTAWSWSPDGRSLLVLGFANSKLQLVDARSGRVTELPWATRSAPSWQRVPVH